MMERVESHGEKILVVDDDVAIRVLLTTVLERMGFKVEVAQDGEEALRKLLTSRYTLLLLDLMMPRVSGFDVLANLDEMPHDYRPHVIVFTAAGPNSVSRIPISSVCTTIHKPFDLSLFLATLRGCIEQKHPLPRRQEG